MTTGKKVYIITAIGCDDETGIEYELNEREYELVDRIAKKITSASDYSCMPIMTIMEK